MTRFTFLAALLTGLVLVSRPVAAQQKQLPTAAEVLAKLKEKRDSGGVQRYKLEFEFSFFQKGQKPGTCRQVWELLIDWRTGKFHEKGWDGCGTKPFEQITVYDGERIKTQFRDVTKEGKPAGDGAWKYGLNTGRLNSHAYQAEWWPVFFHKGAIAGLHDGYYPGHMSFDPDAEKFFVHGEVTRDGRKCLLLKTFPENPTSPMQYEYIIDPKEDYAVVALTYYRKNKPFFALDIDVSATKKPGRWALNGWTFTTFGANSQAEQVVKVKVTDFAENVKIGEDNKFDIAPPDGAKVGRSHYELPEGKQDVKRTEYWYQMKDGKLVQIGGPAPPLWDRVRENWHWFALGAGLAVAAFVGFRARRGWRRGPIAPPAPPADGG